MIEIPKIYEDLPLCEYAPEFEDQTVRVWVNPPRGLLVSLGEISGELETSPETVTEKFINIVAELWSWPVEDVRRLAEHSRETDPLLFQWLTTRTIVMVRDHRQRIKKN